MVCAGRHRFVALQDGSFDKLNELKVPLTEQNVIYRVNYTMDALKAAIEKKRKLAAEEFQGKKFAKVSEIESLRYKKIRDEEEQERLAKVFRIVHFKVHISF